MWKYSICNWLWHVCLFKTETGGKNIALKKSEDERPHTNCRERTEHNTPVPGKLCLQWDRWSNLWVRRVQEPTVPALWRRAASARKVTEPRTDPYKTRPCPVLWLLQRCQWEHNARQYDGVEADSSSEVPGVQNQPLRGVSEENTCWGEQKEAPCHCVPSWQSPGAWRGGGDGWGDQEKEDDRESCEFPFGGWNWGNSGKNWCGLFEWVRSFSFLVWRTALMHDEYLKCNWQQWYENEDS